MQFQRAILFVALSAATKTVAGVPEGFNVQLMPAGDFRAVDGRPEKLKAWTLDEAAANQIVAEFNARANPWPIDYEHQTQLSADNGKPAPAAGWIQALTFVPGVGLWAKVEWTQTAAQYIKDAAYKFISPVFTHDKMGRVKSLLMAALTNTPALDGMNAVALSTLLADRASDGTPNPDNSNDGVNMDLLVALRVALGLKETDTAESALSAVAALKVKADGRDEELVQLRAKAFDPAKHVTLDDHKKLNDDYVALRKAQTDAEVVALVDGAIKDRKLTPAHKDWATKLGQASVVSLKEFLSNATEVAPGTSQTGGKGNDGKGAAVDAADPQAVALKARKYVGEQAALGRMVTASEAVDHVLKTKE